jgi:hypothetical protein
VVHPPVLPPGTTGFRPGQPAAGAFAGAARRAMSRQ